jgi:tRNA-splicing ligase RtcB (3'-phosphate/5'-hydroxy nucleic acid ligase)
LPGARASQISHKAINLDFDRIGTLGAGNHYLEIQVVHPENIYDEELARQFGITQPE